MSREFASIMEAVSGDTVDEKIKVFSDVLDKITQFAVNSIDQLTKKVGYLEQLFQNLQGKITQIAQNPSSSIGAIGAAPPPLASVSATAPPPPAPRPEPKVLSPMSARAALQNELKDLFSKRKS